jgi:hypothetical protein
VKRAILPLAGSALLVAAAMLRLPRPFTLLRPDPNPFRRTVSPFDGRLYALAQAAGPSIPNGARVAVELPGRTPQESAYCAMVVSGLLPGRDVRPAPATPGWVPAFLIRVGRSVEVDGGEILFRLPDGEVRRLDH